VNLSHPTQRRQSNEVANKTRMSDPPRECTFAWKARIPIASPHYRLLDNDVEALRRRLSRLTEGSQVTIGDGVIVCDGPTSRIACATTWKIFQAIEVFAGRNAVTPSEYRMTCSGTAAEHILGVARTRSPATRGDTLPQLRDLFRDNISPSSIPEVCRSRCLYWESRSTTSGPQTAVADPTTRSNEKARLKDSKERREHSLRSLLGPQVARMAAQSMLLLLLVIAYLFYYHMEVQLQILTLPCVEVMREAVWRKASPHAPGDLPGSNQNRGVVPTAAKSGA